MADDVVFQSTTLATPAAGTRVSTEEVTTLNGGAVTAQAVQRVALALRTADATAVDLPGDATNGLKVQANDGGGTLSVDDGGGSLTVDGTVAVSGAVPVTDNGGSLTVDGSVGITGTVAVTDNAGSLTVDGTVTVDDGGSTISVDDGAGSLTVDGTVTVQDGGGAISVDDNGGSLTVDGTVTATLSSSTNAGATAKTLDYDTGAGTDTVTAFGVLLPASGGSVAGGTATAPLRTDPTGSTAQPITDNGGSLTVDGTVTVQDGGGAISIDDNGGNISIDDGGNSITVDASSLPLPTGASTEATLATRLSESDFDTKVGSLTESAPGTDTGSSGLNGRLQRIAQRLTSLIALLPSALVSGRLDVNLGAAPATVTVAQGTATNLKVDASGVAVPITDNAGSITVDGTVAIGTSVTPGTGATNLGKAEDAGHTSGDVGVMNLLVRQDTQAALATTDGDYIPGTTDNNGSLRVVAAGYTGVFSVTLTRPGNTTAYTAGDEVTDTGGAILTLSSIARFSGGTGAIQGIAASFSSNWATKPVLEVWIFDTTSTPQSDNAAFAPSDGVMDTVVAVIPLSAVSVGDATGNTGNFAMDTGPIHYPFQCVGSANLFVRLVIRNAGQAGANSDTIKLRFRASCD